MADNGNPSGSKNQTRDTGQPDAPSDITDPFALFAWAAFLSHRFPIKP
ncbi:MAG TPA: hypothetical protein VK717_12925 [Opitutaceae bacterium]|nr:hypothetical protein [Opitutaceae bacterium]